MNGMTRLPTPDPAIARPVARPRCLSNHGCTDGRAEEGSKEGRTEGGMEKDGEGWGRMEKDGRMGIRS